MASGKFADLALWCGSPTATPSRSGIRCGPGLEAIRAVGASSNSLKLAQKGV